MNQEELQVILENLSRVIDLLYQENIPVAYSGLIGVLPSLEQAIAQLDEKSKQEMTEKLQTALAAMEEGDNTLLADILQYEVVDQLKMCMEA
jgi:type III secretory pathway component EscS